MIFVGFGAIVGLSLATGAGEVLSVFLYGLPAIHIPTFLGALVLFTAIAAQCLANTDGSGGCFISFDESTLGAHSFNWVVTNLQSGNYGVTVQWTPSTFVSDGTYAAAATCVARR